jgi:hypothetical protein
MEKTDSRLKAGYSPSVNIIRDNDVELNYIPTPNAKLAFNQLANSFQVGGRSISIVGAYGTGKSIFLWALEKSIRGEKDYFNTENLDLQSTNGVEFVHIVGEYASFIEHVASAFQIHNSSNLSSKDVIREIKNVYLDTLSSGKGLVIIVDEFGKFLEYASQNHPEKELYFIQQLAELVNDQRKNILFITTLHQDFNGYSRNLSSSQRNEWDKVKGRLKEITFNEPVEQLLFLASERLEQKDYIGSEIKLVSFDKLFFSIEVSKVFPLRDYFNKDIARKLQPFDILAGSVMVLALQKYGQNERSLFSFIESQDHLGLSYFDQKRNPFYNLSCVYDYLINSFYTFLNTKFNPHYTHWASLESAVERAEGLIENQTSEAIKLVKSIGLLNIFAASAARIDRPFLESYGQHALAIKNVGTILDDLERKKIIRFVKHSSRFILFEGTDLDIELAIDEAGNVVQKARNVVHLLNKHFEFPIVAAKKAYYDFGTPRYFAFHLSDNPEFLKPMGEIDGYVNLVFSDELNEDALLEASKGTEEAMLFGWFKKTDDIRTLLFEIEKLDKVIENNPDDRVAIRELNSIKEHQIKLLNHYVIGSLYNGSEDIRWAYNGKSYAVRSQRSFNQLLSLISTEVYHSSPVFRNEMVNKTRLSGVLSKARRNYIQALLERSEVADLGYSPKLFPPDKTVYLSLLVQFGMHQLAESGHIIGKPTHPNAIPLWEAGEDFLNSTRHGKRSLQEFVDVLLSKPFKLKKGFIDFWLPTFLFAKREDFALFGRDGYIPNLSEGTLELVVRAPEKFEVKAFVIDGVKLDVFNKYRTMLNQNEVDRADQAGFITTIRPFLTFYRDLPEYSKRTMRLSDQTLAMREAIAKARDPEEMFFEHLPKAFGFTIRELQENPDRLKDFFAALQDGIRELRSCYESLVERVENYLVKECLGLDLSFPAYKSELHQRYAQLKTFLLIDRQKVLYQRVMSQLDDRNAWLSSITQALVGTPLDSLSDANEQVLYTKLKSFTHEFDNLTEFPSEEPRFDNDVAIRFEVTSFETGLHQSVIRLPKSKSNDLQKLRNTIAAQLTDDPQLNMATLAKLLEDLLRDEK